MENKEKIIVSLTTWEKRINNIPAVLETIYSQTLLPDIVVLNVSEEMQIPDSIMDYIIKHKIELNHVSYKTVYKKIIPTLFKYPDDCIINIDDDWLYPPTMIEDFWETHTIYPDNPISGNREFIDGHTCHCGCASLTKSSFFENLNLIDANVMSNCHSDDIVYTFFAAKAGRAYLWTKKMYYTNLQAYNQTDPYTNADSFDDVGSSWNYLTKRFGKTPSLTELLIKDKMLLSILNKKQQLEYSSAVVQGKRAIRSSKAYQLGYTILKPFNWMIKK